MQSRCTIRMRRVDIDALTDQHLNRLRVSVLDRIHNSVISAGSRYTGSRHTRTD